MTEEELYKKYGITMDGDGDAAESSASAEDALLDKHLARQESTQKQRRASISERNKSRKDGPSVLSKATDKVQLGISDFFSTLAGDTFGRGVDDPTQRTPVSLPMRPISAAADVVRGSAGAIGDVIGAADEAAGRPLSRTMEQMDENKSRHSIYANTGITQARDDLRESYPSIAPAIEDIATVGAALAPYTKVPLKYTGGSKRVASLPEAAKRQRRKDIEKRWRPEGEDALAKGNTIDEVGLMETRQYNPNAQRRQMYDDIEDIDLDPRKSALNNYNKIEDKVEELRVDIDKKLRFEDYMDIDDVNQSIDMNLEEAYRAPTMSTQNPKAAAEAVRAEWDRILDKYRVEGEVKPGDLLQARRDLDAWVRSEKPKEFNAEVFGGQSRAIRAIRDAINKEVANAVPDADVLESLRHQSSLLTARDEITGFAGGEAGNRLGRALQRTQQESGLSMPHSPAAMQTNLQPGSLLVGGTLLAANTLGRGAKKLGRYTGAGLDRTLQEIYNPVRGPLAVAALQPDEEEE